MQELKREIKNGRLLKRNGSWMYCDTCNKTIGYLCYTTYSDFQFDFECLCGNSGSFHLYYENNNPPLESKAELKPVKNRLCCPGDDSPLFSIINKHVKKVKYRIRCKKCQTQYLGE